MKGYIFRRVTLLDVSDILDIYNSNKKFLLNHLGCSEVDKRFIQEEMDEMQNAGFLSCVIVENASQNIVGIIDYKSAKETYLSLLMLHSDFQGRGVGCAVYQAFEQEILNEGGEVIRIDAVNGYEGKVIPFWEKQGFICCGEVRLNWGGQENDAVVMRKIL